MRFWMKVFATSILAVGSADAQINSIVVEDIFGRSINSAGITLLDWEGSIANPAVKFIVKPPSNATFPASTVLSCSSRRIYFDTPSTNGSAGASKTLSYNSASSIAPFYISIWPDRDTVDENYTLNITFTGANGAVTTTSLNIHVIDQDRNNPSKFKVTLDFSRDSTGFFSDAAKRKIIQQAADDWAYFFDDMSLDSVGAGADLIYSWSKNGYSAGGAWVTNSSGFRGYYLLVTGIQNSNPIRSGGEPTGTNFQTSNSVALPIKRAGEVEIDIEGNYNTLGWYIATGDDDWFTTSNYGNEVNDLYSIAYHEIGHALAFNSGHTRFGNAKSAGALSDPSVLAYYGSNPAIDASDHFSSSIDPRSLKGCFGYEYYGNVPIKRWIMTKFNLLCAQAVGYKLRQTDALKKLSVVTASLAQGRANTSYRDSLRAEGAIPNLHWSILSGSLPNGLTLDNLAGVISGTPTASGTFNFTLRLRDQTDTLGVTKTMNIVINPSTGVETINQQLPAEFSLMQNYPNPLNPATTIEFSLPQSGYVTLKVYDIFGKEVATLVSENLSAGRYAARWNAANVASGLYYYRMQAGSFAETRKLILLK